jgi:hypothetical protein
MRYFNIEFRGLLQGYNTIGELFERQKENNNVRQSALIWKFPIEVRMMQDRSGF